MERVLSKIGAFVREKQLIRPKDRVLAGVSGGPDSVCLLLVLLELKAELDFEVTAVHVNHGIRGEEALRDQRFVEKFCGERGVPLECVSRKVQDRALKEKLTLEEAGRICRYEVFREEANRTGCSRIAVGHHGDDQAETMLFHLFRGTGIRGLAGMEPERNGIIRPLLCVERQEILEWLRERRIPWCTDSTNLEEAYTRNRIRHTILPCAREQINEGAVRHMLRTAEELSEIERYLEEETGKAYAMAVCREEEKRLILEKPFGELSPLLADRVIRRCLGELEGGLKDVERNHIDLVKSLFDKQTGSSLSLPGGRRALREYEGVGLGREEPKRETDMETEFCPQIPGVCTVKEKKWLFFLEKAQKIQIIPEKTYTKWFDYDKIENYPVIRRRRPGDYLEINRNHGRKKLKDYLIDQKVPVRERDELFLLADGSHVIWIPGMRISEGFKVTEDTRQILKVQIGGGEENGREGPYYDTGA